MVTDIGGSTINSIEHCSTPGGVAADIDTISSSTPEQLLFSELGVMSEDSNKEREEGSSRSKVIMQPIIGSISGVFDPFMGPYIDFERQKVRTSAHIYLSLPRSGSFLMSFLLFTLFRHKA